MRALLDVNVLIALLDIDHVHHVAATQWLAGNIGHGWASCPLTQNGCIRIMSQSGYPNPLAAAVVAARLVEAAGTPHHRFWPDSVSLLASDTVAWEAILGSRQVSDVYLLALAVRNEGRLVTFDRGIALHAVRGAEPRHLVRL
ncbi:MAG: VapC toxin family PIN domain ribonuclease [Xanthomonadaceae bacterium]|nr:VapC toxin family PIN domain ribonuclease [Xanthomonadaceae bacterium]